jgi:hypothetical protein
MKKFLTIVLALALVCTMTVVAFAAEANTSGTTLDNVASNNSSTATVDVKIEGSEQLTAVYSVVVTWESLDFTYSFTGGDVWDPEEHVYTSGGGGWTDPDAVITVTNHSNVAIRAKASFAGNAPSLTRNDVTATISNPSFTVNSAVGTDPSAAPNGTFTCTVSGVPSITSNFNIGTITISFEAAPST